VRATWYGGAGNDFLPVHGVQLALVFLAHRLDQRVQHDFLERELARDDFLVALERCAEFLGHGCLDRELADALDVAELFGVQRVGRPARRRVQVADRRAEALERCTALVGQGRRRERVEVLEIRLEQPHVFAQLRGFADRREHATRRSA